MRSDRLDNQEKLYLGTSVKIDISMNIDSANSVLISIVNPNGTKVIDGESLSKSANGNYTYIYQSDKYSTSTDKSIEGIYQAEITIINGSYNVVKLYYFEMEKGLIT